MNASSYVYRSHRGETAWADVSLPWLPENHKLHNLVKIANIYICISIINLDPRCLASQQLKLVKSSQNGVFQGLKTKNLLAGVGKFYINSYYQVFWPPSSQNLLKVAKMFGFQG